MKIAFWSNSRGNSGVTSNLACISVASAMEYSYKAILLENHNQKNNLENVLLYDRANYYLREEENYQYKQVGINYIMKQLSNGKYETNMIKNASQMIKDGSLEILSNSLYYIPQNYVTNSEIFDYDLYGCINHVLEVLEKFADITYIDTSNKSNLSSKIILEEVDLVVVNLVQNSSMIKNFFENYSSILSKCVFLISSYHKESSLNINKISKANLINKANIAIIPYNVDYQEAVSQGTIVEFLSRNYNCKRKTPNYNFVNEVKKAAYMIIRNVELISQKEGSQ